MKRIVLLLLFGGVIVSVIALITLDSTEARPQVRKRLTAKYAPAGSPAAWIEKVKETKCSICHNPNYLDEEGDPDREYRNAFGTAVNMNITEDDYKSYKAAVRAGIPGAKAAYETKIDNALKKAGAMKINSEDPKSKTWDQLFKGHKLPENPKPPSE